MQKLLATILLCTMVSIGANAQRQFWGTTSSGGDYNVGFIFKTDSIGDNLEIVHHFKSNVDGENIGALLLASNNKLYGVAASGGQGGGTNVFDSGTFFEFDLTTSQFRVIEHLGPLSTNLPMIYTPRAEGIRSLTEVSPGLIYGLARQGSYVFSYNFNTGVFGKPFTVPNYNGGATNSTLQNQITEAFYKAADGNLYAATSTNSACPIGNPYMGSIVRVIPSTNAFAVRYRAVCDIQSGYTFNGHFAEASGKLYATTSRGGASNQGVIYEYTPSTNAYVKRHDFQGGVAANSFGPTSLIVGKNGKLYGTTHGGGVPEQNLPGGGGTLFEFDLSTNTFTNKYNFLLGSGWLGDVGSFPSSLIKGLNGKLYGCTEFGVFEFNTTSGELRMAGRFWTRGFAPSILQVCRKPYYHAQSATTIEVCDGAAFALDLESTNATTVTWKHDNVVDATQTSTVLSFENFATENEGTWVCTLTNECGTTTSQTFTLVMNAPEAPTITTAGPLAFCDGESTTLSAPEGFQGYHWSNGETSRTIDVTESDDYTVSVNNGCESPVSEPVTVTVFTLPSTPSSIESSGYNKLQAIGESEVYEWKFNGTLMEETTAEISVTETGDYQVRSVSAEGCRSAEFASITFIVAALEDSNNKQVAIYPNPASGIVFVKLSGDLRPIRVSLFNSGGQLATTQTAYFNGEAYAISIADLPSGLYHLLVKKDAKVISANVVVK